MVVKPLSPRPFDKFSESLNLRYKDSKSRKKAQKEQLNPTFSGDLTALFVLFFGIFCICNRDLKILKITQRG